MSARDSEPVSADLINRVAARVRDRLAASEKAAPAESTTYDSVHEAAAVLACFDPGSLRASDGAASSAAVEELLSHSQPVAQPDGTRFWTLSPRIRVTTLRQLRERDRVQAALAANPDRPSGALQKALDAYLCGKGVPVERQSLVELSATYQACEWLRDAGFTDLPDRGRVLRRIDWMTLLQPFEHIVGEHFRGRSRELARMRRYVDVLPSASGSEAVGRWVSRGLSRTRQPLLIYGPGGVGKSALLARFILDHAKAHEKDRYPFIYLDFDRPDVVASEPLTLLVEAVRQLGIEYPDERERCEQIRSDWLDQLARTGEMTDSKRSASALKRFRISAVSDFGHLIGSLGVSNRPVLFVLDTFEEVQWRSNEYVMAIWDLIEQLQEVVDRLRVCISGRGEIPGEMADELPLTGLDEEASIGFLAARGVGDPDVARILARQVKGNPLSLNLAAELAHRERLKDGRLNIDTRGYLFKRVADEVIQGQLYQRILGHIHNKDVERLAHPGLVLRFITPDLIRHVLAGPCHLNVRSDADARALFDELRREVSLVTTVSDDTLEHRGDLRRLMLELLEQDDPRKVQTIHQLAVTWYESRSTGPADRAEEIYHRLSLGQDPAVIDARWKPGVEQYLMSALPEFHGARRAYLAVRLNLAVDEETRRLADIEDWERIVERRTRDLLGQGRPEEALALLTSRGDRTGASPLFDLEATALAQLGRWADGFTVLDRGIEEALAATARQQVLCLTLEQAELVLAWRSAKPAGQEPALQSGRRLRELTEGSLAPADRLTVRAHQLALFQEVPDPTRKATQLEKELRRTFDDLPDETLGENPGPSRWAASVLRERDDVRRIARVLRVCGLPRADEAALYQAGASIAQMDVRSSTKTGERPGMLAREFGIPEQDSLTATWSNYLLTTGEEAAGNVLGRLLEEHASAVSADLVGALAILMRSALGAWTRAPEAPAPEPDSGRPRDRVSAQVLQELGTTLTEVFPSRDVLREFLRQGLDRSLESMVPTGSSQQSAVWSVVQAAYREGWLDVLVARAREAFPASVPLARTAEELGLSSLAPSGPSLAAGPGMTHSTSDVGRWTERLTAIERQVCRVEARDRQLLGTGFLIGPDLVLTADHVLSSLWNGSLSPAEVTLRFDLTGGSHNQVVTEGTLFRLGEVVRRSPRLDYALLRVDGAPGVQPIGGSSGPGGTLRRWIEALPPHPLEGGEGLFMVGYTRERSPGPKLYQGEVLRLRYESVGYTIRSEPGSSGAPCFSPDLELVALNTRQNSDPDAPKGGSVGVLISAVRDDLAAEGLGDSIGTTFA